MRELEADFSLTERGELEVVLDSPGPLTGRIDFPPPLETSGGERLIVPLNEGMGFPVDEEHQGLYRLSAYSGHGICMAFFGAVEDRSGSGWMCILEDSDDAAMNAFRSPAGLWQAGPSWDAQRGQFGYARRVRYLFFDTGGHVALCKRYREHARARGLLKTLKEKSKRTPKIDLLVGAANIWNWDAGADKARFVAEIQAAGIKRILWSGGGSGETQVESAQHRQKTR